MKKGLLCMVGVLLLLCGCAEEDDTAQRIMRQYESMQRCRMEAVVRCEYESERREYTLQCRYDAGGESRVTVLKPAALQDISVILNGEERQVVYGDLVLDAPRLGQTGLSPVNLLPCLLDAVKHGWLLEEMKVDEEGKQLQCMVFETEEQGKKQYWTVLFDEATGYPVAAELTEDSRLFFTMVFTEFIINDIISSNESGEDTTTQTDRS